MRQWKLYRPSRVGYLPDAAIKDAMPVPSMAVEHQVAAMDGRPALTGIECAGCGVRFLKRQYYIDRNNRLGRRHFCTRNCAAQSRKKSP